MTPQDTRRWLTEPPAAPISAELVVLDAPLSFWGGLDATTGTIIDRAHPQCGAQLGGHIVAMPGSRGSSGTPGVLGEAIRRGVGPVALVLTTPDINLVTAALVTEALYDTPCPILLLDHQSFAQLARSAGTPITLDG